MLSSLPLEYPWDLHLGLEILYFRHTDVIYSNAVFFRILASSPTLIANNNNNVPLLVPQKNAFFISCLFKLERENQLIF